MRVGIDATCIPHAVAGAGRYIIGLVEGLAAVPSPHEFVVYCRSASERRFAGLPERFSVRAIPNYSRARRLMWQTYSTPSLMQQDGLSVWHATHYVTPRRAQVPVLTTIHDLAFFAYPEFYAWHKRRFFQHAIRSACDRASALLAVSETTRADLADRFPGSAPVHHIASGIGHDFLKVDARGPSPGSRPYLLAVGTQEKRKNLPFLVEVLATLRRDFPDIELVIVGQPENDSKRLKAAIRRYGLEKSVRLPGYVSARQLRAYYAHAEVLCHPAHHEGFGFPVLEAMAAGTPVLAAARPAMTEIGGQHVRSVSCSDTTAWVEALRDMLLHPASAEKRAAARRHAAGFSWRETAERTMEIYEHLAPKRQWRSGSALRGARAGSAAGRTPASIEDAILKTVVYADVFDYPLGEKEIHDGLLGRRAQPAETREAIGRLTALGTLSRSNGHIHLPGRAAISRLRETRERASLQLLDKHRRTLKHIAHFPFVRAVAISGALAFGNGKDDDDIDLFIIAREGRLWFVYAGLVVLLKLLGKRRSLCLNFLVSERANPEMDQSDYIAHQIAHLRPLYDAVAVRAWQSRYPWIRQFLPHGGMRAPLSIPVWPRAAKRSESFFGLKWFDIIERFVYKSYKKRILRQAGALGEGAVHVSKTIIKLFTNDHVPDITRKFAARERAAAEREPSMQRDWH